MRGVNSYYDISKKSTKFLKVNCLTEKDILNSL